MVAAVCGLCWLPAHVVSTCGSGREGKQRLEVARPLLPRGEARTLHTQRAQRGRAVRPAEQLMQPDSSAKNEALVRAHLVWADRGCLMGRHVEGVRHLPAASEQGGVEAGCVVRGVSPCVGNLGGGSSAAAPL